jgi:hypothetical protein
MTKMKKIASIFSGLRIKSAMTVVWLLSISGILSAQHVLKSDLNLPRVGDRLIKQKINYLPPGEGGEHQTWDFSRFKVVDNEHSLLYFSRNDFGLIGAEDGQLFSYYSSGDSLFIQGYEDPTTLVSYHQPGLLLKFPLVYDSSSDGSFYGRGKRNDRLEMLVSGEINTRTDAFGSIVLPMRDTLNNMMRVHIHKEEKNCYSPVSSGFDIEKPLDISVFADTLLAKPDLIITDTYQWYREGNRYPVFETIESYRSINEELIPLGKSSFFYHPEDQTDDLPADPENSAVLTRLEEKRMKKQETAIASTGNITSFHCYPNPVKEQLEVDFYLSNQASVFVRLYDEQGKLLYQSPEQKQSGNCHQRIKMSGFPAGNYLLNVYAGSEKLSEKIVKQ